MFTAGYSMPGCLPEMEPATFDTATEAWAWLSTEAEFAGEYDTADKLAAYPSEPGSLIGDDGYAYWVEYSG